MACTTTATAGIERPLIAFQQRDYTGSYRAVGHLEAAIASAAPDHPCLTGASPFRPRFRYAGLRDLDRARLAAFTQDGRGAMASVESPDGSERIGLAGDHHLRCDGARSVLRRAIDAGGDGDARLQRAWPAFIRAPGLLLRMRA